MRKPATAKDLLELVNPRRFKPEKKEPKPISKKIRDREDPTASRARQTSLAYEIKEALPESSLVAQSRLAAQTSLAEQAAHTEPPVSGYLKLPNAIIDRVLPSLAPDRQAVYLQLYRLSWGFGKELCTVSLPGLRRRTQVSERQISRCIEELEQRGLIEKIGATFGRGKQQGTTFRVVSQTSLDREARLDGRASNKEKLKKQYLKIAAALRDLYVGGSADDLKNAVRRKCEREGVAWDEAVWREIVESR